MTYLYHTAVDSPLLPRDIAPDSAQSALLTVLGELFPPSQFVPSAVLVEVLALADISEVASRAAISRLSRKGTLSSRRKGRNTEYALSAAVVESLPQSAELTMGFGETERAWDGEWTVVTFSIPESQRERRQSVREWLRWLGYGPLRDGVWIAPRSSPSATEEPLFEVLGTDGLVFSAAHLHGEINPANVWALDELRARYNGFCEEFRPEVYRLRAGTIAPHEAFRLWLRLLGTWRAFPTVDPDLPDAALPIDWPRREARRIFVSVHDACIPLVSGFVRTSMESHSPEASSKVHGQTVAEALAYYRRTLSLVEAAS